MSTPGLSPTGSSHFAASSVGTGTTSSFAATFDPIHETDGAETDTSEGNAEHSSSARSLAGDESPLPEAPVSSPADLHLTLGGGSVAALLPEIEVPRERPPLMRIIFHFAGHSAAVEAQRPILDDKGKYTQYLVHLKRDLSQLEKLIAHHEIPMSHLPVLTRTEALTADLAFLEASEADCSAYMKEHPHEEYFRSIADSAPRLLAHLYVHYLGFLFGGQSIKTGIALKYGEEATHLYQFAEEATPLRSQTMTELQAYLDSLSNPEFLAFQEEMEKAWPFACDLLDYNMRTA